MRVRFVVTHAYRPELVTGGILNAHNLALGMTALGHDVEVLAERYGTRRLLPYRIRQKITPWLIVKNDRLNGYHTRRVGGHMLIRLVEECVQRDRPDVLILHGTKAQPICRAVATSVPVILHIVSPTELYELADAAASDGELARALRSPQLRVVANSHYVSRRVRERLGLSAPVAYSVVDREACVARERRPRYITFVNPGPRKGVDVALALARRLTHRQFLFVDGWMLGDAERSALVSEIATLPNVHFEPATTDVRDLYARTLLMLVPSQWEEGFGRVALEATANGVPVVASLSGGLPEAVGDGGILVPVNAPIEQWADAIEAILSDGSEYERLGARGLEHSRSEKFEPRRIAQTFIDIATEIHKGSAPML